MMGLLEAVYSAQEALAEAMSADEAFSGVKVDTGYPLVFAVEHSWVSCTLDVDVEPVDTNLALMKRTPRIGGGIAVRQYSGEWAPVRDRLLELVSAFEALIAADHTLGGTCTAAHIAAFSVKEQVKSPTELGLLYLYDLGLQQYG
jgi:hypothetical protein